MDNFNIIPKDGLGAGIDTVRAVAQKPAQFAGDKLPPKQDVEYKKKVDIIFWVVTITVIGTIGYLIYLVGMRFYLLSQISGISKDLQQLQSSINSAEIADLQTVDSRLKLINTRLGSHILTGVIFDTINQHIRVNTQVMEYKISVTDTELNVSLSEIAPTFKEMAEQTERLFVMKDQGLIKNFTITNLAYEQDTRKVRFTIKMVLDKDKYSALAVKIVQQS